MDLTHDSLQSTRMQIKLNDIYSESAELLKFATPETIAAIKEAAVAMYGDYWEMTIGRLIKLDSGDYSSIGYNGSETIAQHYWLEGLREFGKDLAKIARGLQIPKSLLRKYEMQARTACINTSAAEGMLIFTQKYFGLHSFREAENITVSEYIIARRADYNSTVMQRKAEQLQMAEIKQRRTK